MPRSFLIQNGNSQIQISCESDPKKIRDKKKSRAAVDFEEQHGIYGYERKKCNKPNKREKIRLKIEEYDRPHEIEEKLNAVDGESGF